MKKTIKKLEEMGKRILDEIKKKENPHIEVPVRSLSNIFFDENKKIVRLGESTSKRYFFNVSHIRKFVQTVDVATISKKLLEVNKSEHIRSVYYMLRRTLPGTKINLVDDQDEVDRCVEDLELVTGCLREELHINAKKSGAVAGNVVIKDSGDTIDWSRLGRGGWAIPSNVEEIEFKKVDAEFVLYMEKESVWERLQEDKIWKDLNCIIMCSMGQTTRGIRRLLYRLRHEFGLPILVLTDFDPWGIYIYSVLKYGSINLAYLSEKLTIRDAKFLGITADDIEKYNLKKHFEKLNDKDIKRLKEVSEYPWFKNNEVWQRQFRMMMKFKSKVEIQALSSHGISFITEKYLPEKISSKDWL
ncbi:MAG: DNA topoisomerase IV subunit A, partial [Candidatus Micrarchaeota archaeon]|nr:DNA topoisomerase IV subunit A [Candidatus Micrarchaeota archaeon]